MAPASPIFFNPLFFHKEVHLDATDYAIERRKRTEEILAVLDGVPLDMADLILEDVCIRLGHKHNRWVDPSLVTGLITKHTRAYSVDEG